MNRRNNPPSEEPRPYAHVSVPEEGAKLDLDVVFHDGSAMERISGEIHCTLTALTPLLCGNEHYKLEDTMGCKPVGGPEARRLLENAAKSKYPDSTNQNPQKREREQKNIERNRRDWINQRCRDLVEVSWFPGKKLHKGRNVIEPICLSDGRVVIPGGQIKGMLRQSIGALLAAPMERVADQTYSYRPNLKWEEIPGRWDVRPAKIITTKKYKGYEVPDKINVYQRGDRDHPRFNRRYDEVDRYRGGLEAWTKYGRGQHSLAKSLPHTSADLNGLPVDKIEIISDDVHRLWQFTMDHLMDTKCGHISSRHPSVGNEEKKQKAAFNSLKRGVEIGFNAGDIIFVEWDTNDEKVVSYGNNFRYRWRYVDSIRKRFDEEKYLKAKKYEWQERPEVSPRDFEKCDRPQKLTGARALFGYTGDNDGVKGIGKGDFSQLAGRIAFNWAVEVLINGRNEEQRFLNLNLGSGYAVSLRELGLPKPSAVEFYLDQSLLAERKKKDKGIVITYGDLLNHDPRGSLNGRKFYRHNAKAALDSNQYCATSDHELMNERASIARFVSTPGTSFRFSIRFQDLSKAELGVLLVALCPNQAVSHLPENFQEETAVRLDGNAGNPRYAVKLGYARPLGWGSVEIRWDEVKLLEIDESACKLTTDIDPEECVNGAATLLHKPSFKEWLDIHDYRDSKWHDYPGFPGDIFKWHSGIRMSHSTDRRSAPAI